jgi:hypothetical protein
MNIFAPVAFLAVAYYVDQTGGKTASLPHETLNVIFWVLTAVSVIDGALAIFLKQRLFYSPMVSSMETFEDDIVNRSFTASIVCFAITTAISVYGLVFYFLGGTFSNLLFFVFMSFIAFQLIRPRIGFMKKVIEAQEKHVAQGRFFRGKKV